MHTLWGEYETLFSQTPERGEFLNKVAGSFFYLAEHAFWDSILLMISRLTGPVSTGRGKSAQLNITLQKLPVLVASPIRNQVGTAVTDAVAAAGFCKDARNKWIAHLDEPLMLDPAAKQITLGSRREAKLSMQKIGEVLNIIQMHYEGSPTSFTGRTLDGADSLLYTLERGVKALDDDHEALLRLAKGN
jgi:hypothetical protein